MAAVIAGLVVGMVVTLPWAFLVQANLDHWSAAPWAAPLTAAYVWLWWRYVSGGGWPRSSRETRRLRLRANAIPEDVWGMALVAGVLGIAASLIVLRVTSRLATIPEQALPERHASAVTLLVLSLTGAVVAGVVEEASFRGYMQGPLEKRYGPVVAIFVTGTVFGLAHFNHPGVLAMMPFYMTLATTYGTIAYLTNSIVPGIVLHAGGDALGAVTALAQGRQTSSLPIPAASTASTPLLVLILLLIAVVASALFAFRALAQMTHVTSTGAVGSRATTSAAARESSHG
jgi:uncharacterized protein